MQQDTLLTETLRTATYDQIVRMGALPFFKAISAHQLTPDSYVALLSSLTTIYDAFDLGVTHASYPPLSATWAQHVQRKSLLMQDRAAFAAHQYRPVPAANLRAEVVAEQIRARALRDPLSMLGGAYILAVWNMGGVALNEQLVNAFRFNTLIGVSYLASFDTWGPSYWPQFAAIMDAVPVDTDAVQRVLASAREILDGIEDLITLLHPLNENPTGELVMLINPRAGNHRIPDDFREVQAAMRAGERSWLQFPYYERRYVQHGRKFTWSDSNWMVTLAEQNQATVNQQIQWLSRFLATRGMPQWTMECHLQLLHEELVQAVPEKRSIYGTLYEAAHVLAEQRRVHMSDATLIALDQAFEAHVGPEWSAWLPHAGGLLASAVADEKDRVPRAVESIESWMVDPSRFPPAWIEAVHTIIQQARH